MEFVIVSHVMCLIKVELGRRYAIESKTRVDGRIRHVWADALRSVGELHAGHQLPGPGIFENLLFSRLLTMPSLH